MHIESIEIGNFRKLASARVEFAADTTVLVGANNSGKTTAMAAMRRFLVSKRRFHTIDFTLSHWTSINEIGEKWDAMAAAAKGELPSMDDWNPILPFLDIWLNVADHELHYVTTVIPHLDWTGGLLGIRMRLEPDDVQLLYMEFVTARRAVTKLLEDANKATGKPVEINLWPKDMIAFLQRKLNTHFTVRCYVLDPAKQEKPVDGLARPQPFPEGAEAVKGDPVSCLIRVDEIGAQRGFDDEPSSNVARDSAGADSRQLANQLRPYFEDHLNPFDEPDISDLEALGAIETAGKVFDDRLDECFRVCFHEIETLGYPGVFDPKIRVVNVIKPMDGLSHDSAVQYEVKSAIPGQMLRLPESYNGLGYQNLVSIIFKLMSFRDGWMLKGKAAKKASNAAAGQMVIPPIHLVLVEEPEAHLHAQVQQVFIRKAYDVLRQHPDLLDKTNLRTQLVVSTHSSHIAHEVAFANLRYFRRLPAGGGHPIPTSEVVNMTTVFGEADDTRRFVTRYLTATHCDLFFADAVIIVEGAAERMMLPNFVKRAYPTIHQSYVSWLEVGGSHAHRFRTLIEHLGLTTLVVTDLDAGHGETKISEPAKVGTGQITNNATLRLWCPAEASIDALIAKDEEGKVAGAGKYARVRVVYQIPASVKFGDLDAQIIGNTYEDALVIDNIEAFKAMDGDGLIAKFRAAAVESKTADELALKLSTALKSGKKAEFSMDLLEKENFVQLKLPTYIRLGLDWLKGQLTQKQVEVIAEVPAPGPEAI